MNENFEDVLGCPILEAFYFLSQDLGLGLRGLLAGAPLIHREGVLALDGEVEDQIEYPTND